MDRKRNCCTLYSRGNNLRIGPIVIPLCGQQPYGDCKLHTTFVVEQTESFAKRSRVFWNVAYKGRGRGQWNGVDALFGGQSFSGGRGDYAFHVRIKSWGLTTRFGRWCRKCHASGFITYVMLEADPTTVDQELPNESCHLRMCRAHVRLSP